MTSIDRIEKVVEILQNLGRLRRTELAKRLMKEGDMTKQTAYNAIDESVELGKVKREERLRGKEMMAFYTVHFDIEENEKYIYEFFEKGLKQFDFRFEFFKDKFANLTTEEKVIGLKSFDYLCLSIHVAVGALWHNFGRSNEWQTLLDKANSKNIQINELMNSTPNEEQAIIKKNILEKKTDIINDAFIELDEFLEELRGK
ncbi:MAG: hypothetical protein KGZ34_03555 [Nitrosarchaeum sp.]|nr:hypothetical protein [Nitrosarchaeum sp.]